jgi:hypothetical protein
MKHLLLIGLLLSLLACKKSTDPAPLNADRIVGTYTVTRLVIDAPGTADDRNLTLPITQGGTTISATFDVAKVAESSVSMTFTLRQTGQGQQVQTIGNFIDLRGNELYEGTQKIGTADGTTLNLDVTDNGTRTIFEARK